MLTIKTPNFEHISDLVLVFSLSTLPAGWRLDFEKICYSLQTYSKPCQTSKIEHFAKIFSFQSFAFCVKSSTLDIWQASEYVFVLLNLKIEFKNLTYPLLLLLRI